MSSVALLSDSKTLLDPIPAPVEDLDTAALEWHPLLALVAGYAISRVGREGLLATCPSTNQPWIERQHQLVVELRALLNTGATIPLGGLFDPTQLAEKSQIPGAALEPGELQSIARIANDIAAWQSLLKNPPASAAGAIPGLFELLAQYPSLAATNLSSLAESIQRKLLPDGTLADHASPELARIRSEQLRQKRVIDESLRAALRRLSASEQTQDDLITIRGDRFVIPVKADQKRKVSGVVHGASSSGQTVYVEPLETIEQNNELVRLLEEEQVEIHRIFVALTRVVGTYAESLVAGAHLLALVDSLQARARFSVDYDCTRPIFSPQLFRLESARHPLLEKRLKASGGTIVPFTLQLESTHRQLIISGPNTGGKTVTLKTTALCALMAQSGIPVPAAAATLPIFTAFLADIGDAQSIEQALSAPSPRTSSISTASRTSPAPQHSSCSTSSAQPPTPTKAPPSP